MEPMNERQKRLAAENMGLVGATIKRMRLHYDLDDLFGIGYVGLCKAALHFREGGLCFTTYATHIIRHDLISYLNKNNPARRPALVSLDVAEAVLPSRAEEDYTRLEDRLSLEELLRRLDDLLDPDDAAAARLLLRRVPLPEIARRCGLSESSIRGARARIRACFQRFLRGEEPERARKAGAPAKGSKQAGGNNDESGL